MAKKLKSLTERQKEFLRYIIYYKDQYQAPPTRKTIAIHFEITVQSVGELIYVLQKKGYVEVLGKYRGAGYKLSEQCLLYGVGAIDIADKKINRVSKKFHEDS